MQYRTLGRTGLRVSVVGLGTGGTSVLGQAAGRPPEESKEVVRAALDLGVNFFDTARAYQDSELLLGEVLQGVPRDRYILATKYRPRVDNVGKGTLAEDPAELTGSLEESLQRLGVDTVDVFQLHDVRAANYDEVVERFYPMVKRAQAAGKVRFIGITESRVRDPRHEMFAERLSDGLFDTIMVKYGIFNQTAEEQVFPLAREHNIGVLVMAPVRTSLRTPEEAVQRISDFIDEGQLKMQRTTVEDPLGLGRTGEPVPRLTRAAYRFAVTPDAVSTLLVGTGRADHLRANTADILGPPLSQGQLAYLRETFGQLAWGE